MIASPWKNERVLESFTVAIFILDADWRFEYVNPAAEDVLKRPMDELVGQNVWSEFPEATGTIFEREYRRAVKEDVAVRFEAFYAPLDIWVQVYAYPTEDGLTVIFQDITERKMAEQDAERLQARNRAIVRALPDDLYMISLSGVIVEAENGGTGSGDDLNALLGRSIDEVFPANVARRFHEAMSSLRDSGETRVMSFELPPGVSSLAELARTSRKRASNSPNGSNRIASGDDGAENSTHDGGHDGTGDRAHDRTPPSGGADGPDEVDTGSEFASTSPQSRYLEARVVPVEGTGVLAIVRDVTTERSLQRQVLQVTKQERERIGRDLHDGIGSLLSGISMMSGSLARDAEEGREIDKEQLREISRLAKKGVAQARALSHGLNPIDVEPDRFVASVREMAANTRTMTGVNCYLDEPDDIGQLKDEVATQLYWVAQEAVNNAVRHADCSKIAIGIWRNGDELLVRVRDDGKGLPDESVGGMGRKTMRYRAQVIGATLEIVDRTAAPMRRDPPDDPEKTDGVDVICRLPIWKAIAGPSDTSEPHASATETRDPP